MLGALLIMGACAKEPTRQANKLSKDYFESWVAVHHPQAKATKLGAYIIKDQEGIGAEIGSASQNPYLLVNYTISSLDGDIAKTTRESVSKQIGQYDEGNFYGPRVWNRELGALYVGLEDAISTMKVGGKRKVAIPSWLMNVDKYPDAASYLEKGTNGVNTIYDVEIKAIIPDIVKWELDSIERYIAKRYTAKPAKEYSLKSGLYYIQLKEPKNQKPFRTDTTIYINYTGRLLNGKVFDTTIKDTAKLYGIYNSEKTYAPTSINWNADDYTKITMSADKTTVVDGFSFGLSKMHIYEKARVIFCSSLGYGSKENGNTIPEYSPLVFDIEIVDKN